LSQKIWIVFFTLDYYFTEQETKMTTPSPGPFFCKVQKELSTTCRMHWKCFSFCAEPFKSWHGFTSHSP